MVKYYTWKEVREERRTRHLNKIERPPKILGFDRLQGVPNGPAGRPKGHYLLASNMRKAGMTLSEIGLVFDVTGERIRHLSAKGGFYA